MSKPAKQRRAEREARARAARQYMRKKKESVLDRNERLLRGPPQQWYWHAEVGKIDGFRFISGELAEAVQPLKKFGKFI